MFNKLRKSVEPDYKCRRLAEVDAGRLRADGINYLVLDVDNTVCRFNEYDIDDDNRAWIKAWLDAGGRAALCSNNFPPRVEPVAQDLGLPYLPRSGKPKPEAYLNACKLMDAQPEHSAEIGDQLVNDVRGAKRAGLKAVWVNPLGRKEFLGTYANRIVERIIMLLTGIRRAK